MKKTMLMTKRRIIYLILFVIVLAAVLTAALSAGTHAAKLEYWADSESRTAFLSYISDVTNPKSENFIPETDRLAVFDLDGTLCGEQFPTYFEWMMYVQRVLDDPTYVPTQEQIDVAEAIVSAARDQHIPAGLEEQHFLRNAEVYAGMTVEEYRAYTSRFLQMGADRFQNLAIGDAWFRTTVEAAKYLQQNGFTVYVCSGTDREADRIFIADIIGIPYRQVIGSDCYTVGSGQEENAYLDYQYTPEDVPVRTANTVIKNVKSSKPMQILQELGQRPVVAFGNSTGDTSMFVVTTNQNPYRSIAFCVVPDDDVREVAYPDKVEKLTALCRENGWYPVSMKHDFVTVYGDGVTLDLNHTPWLDRMTEKTEELRPANAA